MYQTEQARQNAIKAQIERLVQERIQGLSADGLLEFFYRLQGVAVGQQPTAPTDAQLDLLLA